LQKSRQHHPAVAQLLCRQRHRLRQTGCVFCAAPIIDDLDTIECCLCGSAPGAISATATGVKCRQLTGIVFLHGECSVLIAPGICPMINKCPVSWILQFSSIRSRIIDSRLNQV
jgi:hypothetical protein